MPEIHWNIDVLAAFVSLGGLFFGLDTDMYRSKPTIVYRLTLRLRLHAL